MQRQRDGPGLLLKGSRAGQCAQLSLTGKGYRGIYKSRTNDDLHQTRQRREQLPLSVLGTLKPYSSTQKAPIYQAGQGDLLPLLTQHAQNTAVFLLQNIHTASPPI